MNPEMDTTVCTFQTRIGAFEVETWNGIEEKLLDHQHETAHHHAYILASVSIKVN